MSTRAAVLKSGVEPRMNFCLPPPPLKVTHWILETCTHLNDTMFHAYDKTFFESTIKCCHMIPQSLPHCLHDIYIHHFPYCKLCDEVIPTDAGWYFLFD
jgi:hypothetical protein